VLSYGDTHSPLVITIVLFTESEGSTTGKCSHGGLEDESRTMIAKCGINKDSFLEEWSPHNHLHCKAYSAAVNATKHFLIAEGNYYLHNSRSKLDEVCHMWRRNCLPFPDTRVPSVFSGVRVARSLVFCVVFCTPFFRAKRLHNLTLQVDTPSPIFHQEMRWAALWVWTARTFTTFHLCAINDYILFWATCTGILHTLGEVIFDPPPYPPQGAAMSCSVDLSLGNIHQHTSLCKLY
jgi:hypothetical protein